jgi:hypothetical protein
MIKLTLAALLALTTLAGCDQMAQPAMDHAMAADPAMADHAMEPAMADHGMGAGSGKPPLDWRKTWPRPSLAPTTARKGTPDDPPAALPCPSCHLDQLRCRWRANPAQRDVDDGHRLGRCRGQRQLGKSGENGPISP